MSEVLTRAIKRTLQNEYRRSVQKRSGVRKASISAGASGRGAVVAAGQVFPASNINATAGATVAVRNVGRIANALYQPDTSSSLVYNIGTPITITGEGGGGGGSTLSAGDGISIVSNVISVNVPAIIDSARAISVTAGNLGLQLNANSGLRYGSGGGLEMGTLGTIAWDSQSIISGTSHNHAIATVEDAGANVSPVRSILRSSSSGHLGLGALSLGGNLTFIDTGGVGRSIVGTTDLTIANAGDLTLNPNGNVYTPNSQEVRATLIQDLPTGILGYRLWARPEYPNYQQLTIGAIKADELYVRVFVADETRIDRGEEYWSKSFGLVQTDFALPAIGSTVDVWFEDAPAAIGFNLFSNGDYLLMRTIDWGTGLVVQKIWWQVAAAKLAQETTAANGVDRQRWRIRRIAGGSTTGIIKRGSLALDVGVVGQGWIHLSALDQDGGPFIQIGEMTSVATVPQFANRVRMGNLNGVVGISEDFWGFAAGNELGLGITPTSGFSGFVAGKAPASASAATKAYDGMTLFNTDLRLYSGASQVLALSRQDGLVMKIDPTQQATAYPQIRWSDTVPYSNERALITAWGVTARTDMISLVRNQAAGGVAHMQIAATSLTQLATLHLDSFPYASLTTALSGNNPSFVVSGNFVGVGFNPPTLMPASRLHVYESNANTNEAVGVLIEQASTGDAVLHWKLTTGGRVFSAGIDNSAGDVWKLSANSSLGVTDFIVVDPTTGVVTINGLSGGSSSSGLIAGDGIDIAGSTISVDTTVARSGWLVNAGNGLSGGGGLVAGGITLDIVGVVGGGISVNANSIGVDNTVVRTTQQVIAGNGLAGGGALTGNVTLDIGGGNGITVLANSIEAKPHPAGGLNVDGAGLYIDPSFVGGGLALSPTWVASVGAGNGISVLADSIEIKLLSPFAGLTVDSLGLRVRDDIAGNGLLMSSSKIIDLVAGNGSLTVGADNVVVNYAHNWPWTGDHTFSTGTVRFNTTPQVNANLNFLGVRNITSNDTLGISPTGDLWITPSDLVVLPIAKELRSELFNDLPTGIDGMRLFNSAANHKNLTLHGIKADELYVRVFVADETRIDRGEEYWSKSFGLVEEESPGLPPLGSTFDVWLEDAPGVGPFALFTAGDYILVRTIDWSVGLVVMMVWLQVVDGGGAGGDWILRDDANDRQKWRLRRLGGGSVGYTFKKGTLLLDVGTLGQGWIHLSALEQDGGPFIQVGDMTSLLGGIPQFTNRVRMGNLSGTVGIAEDFWGFAAGNNLGRLPSDVANPFSGIVAGRSSSGTHPYDGMALFNVDLEMYSGGSLMARFNNTTGLTLDFDIAPDATVGRFIRWQDDPRVHDPNSNARIGAWKDVNTGRNRLGLLAIDPAGNPIIDSYIENNTSGQTATTYFSLDEYRMDFFSGGGSFRVLSDGKTLIGGISSPDPLSRLHVYDNNSETGIAAGLLIEQDGAGGDAVLHWRLTDEANWSAGIDNDASNGWKLSNSTTLGTNPIISAATSGFVGISAALPEVSLDVRGDSAIRHRLASVTAGGVYVQSILHGSSLDFARVSFAHNARYDPATRTWITEFTGGSDASAMIVRNGGGFDWIIHPSATSPMSNTSFMGGRRMALSPGAELRVGLSLKVGDAALNVASSILHVYENNSNTGTAAGATIEQAGGGDALLRFLVLGQGWTTGIDNTDKAYKITAGTVNIDINPVLTLTTGRSAGINTPAPGLNIVGSFDYNPGNVLQINSTGGASVIVHGDNGSTVDMVTIANAPNERWFRYGLFGGGKTNYQSINDTGAIVHQFMTLDHTTGYIGLDEVNPGAKLEIASQTDAIIQPAVRAVVYGSGAYHFMGRRALNTQGVPVAVTSGQTLLSIGAQGYLNNGTWPSSTVAASLHAVAAQTHSPTAQGAKWQFFVTKINTTTTSVALDLGDDRQFFAPGVDSHVTAAAPNVNVETGTGSGWLRRSTSSRLYKRDIRDLNPDAKFIDKLRPVLYRPRTDVGGGNRDFVGLIAEEVVDAGGRDYVFFGEKDQPEGVMYDRLVVVAISELQSLRRRVSELEARLN
jgi:hypothetical protein